MKRLPLQEWLFLLLPAVFLAGAAFYWQKREELPKPDLGQFRLVITKIERVRITPREAFLGYDTKVVITTERKGNLPILEPNTTLVSRIKPAHQKLIARSGAKWIPEFSATKKGALAVFSYDYDAQPNKLIRQSTFLLKLGQVAKKEGELKVIGSLEQNYNGWIKTTGKIPTGMRFIGKSGLYTMVNFRTPPVAFSSVVRAENQSVVLPQVSKVVPLVISSAEQELLVPEEGLMPSGYIKVDKEQRTKKVQVTVKGKVFTLPNATTSPWFVDDLHLEDEQGRKYYRFRDALQPKHPKIKIWTTAAVSGGENPVPSNRHLNPTSKDSYTFSFRTDISRVPLSAGQLTLKGNISFNGAWPLPFSVVVRTQTECGAKPKLLTLQKALYFVSPISDRNDRVQVTFKYSGQKPFVAEDACNEPIYASPNCYKPSTPSISPRLISNWWQYIEDDKGQRINSYIKGKDYYRYWFSASSASYDEASKTVLVDYIGSTEHLKKDKPYFLIVHVGVEGDKMLPVRVPIPIKK